MLDGAALLRVSTHHVAGGVLEVDDGRVRLAAQLNELGGLHRAFRLNRPIVGDDADGVTLDHRAAADRLRAKPSLELEEV